MAALGFTASRKIQAPATGSVLGFSSNLSKAPRVFGVSRPTFQAQRGSGQSPVPRQLAGGEQGQRDQMEQRDQKEQREQREKLTQQGGGSALREGMLPQDSLEAQVRFFGAAMSDMRLELGALRGEVESIRGDVTALSHLLSSAFEEAQQVRATAEEALPSLAAVCPPSEVEKAAEGGYGTPVPAGEVVLCFPMQTGKGGDVLMRAKVAEAETGELSYRWVFIRKSGKTLVKNFKV